MGHHDPKIVFVVGPTASGKSALALHLAKKFSGAIINCDSIQSYQGLNIGSAKPTADEQKQVPHFLFDLIPSPHELTAGEYRRHFFETVKSNSFPVYFVVGGTGFYFLALEKGMYEIGPVDPGIKQEIETDMATPAGAQKLYQELQSIDPVSAEKISPNDHYRIGRALEIWRTHRLKPSEVKRQKEEQQQPFPYKLAKIGVQVSKEDLRQRITMRTQEMLRQGFVTEVKSLLSQGLQQWAPMDSVGYREIKELLLHGEDLNSPDKVESLLGEIVQSTMKLVKKQKTWFQRDMQIQWFEPSQLPSDAEKFIEHFLKSGS